MTKQEAINVVKKATRIYGYVRTDANDGSYIRLYKYSVLKSLNSYSDEHDVEIEATHEQGVVYFN